MRFGAAEFTSRGMTAPTCPTTNCIWPSSCCFVKTGPDELGAQHRAQVQADDPEQPTLAWAGPVDPHLPHYYRVSTCGLLVESDNAVASGQHIHSVWRDLTNDLLQHYENYGHHGRHPQSRLHSTAAEGK